MGQYFDEIDGNKYKCKRCKKILRGKLGFDSHLTKHRRLERINRDMPKLNQFGGKTMITPEIKTVLKDRLDDCKNLNDVKDLIYKLIEVL